MQKTNRLFFCFCLLGSLQANAGTGDTTRVNSTTSKHAKELPCIGLGFGVLSYEGDVGSSRGSGVGGFTQIRPGFHFNVEQRLNDWIGVSLNGMYGSLSGSNYTTTDHLNFETKVTQGDLNLILPFNNGKIMKKDAQVAPYLSFGLGVMMFNPYGDLKDSNGNPYYYWSDGSIRNLPQTAPNANTAVRVLRDYSYETPLKDSLHNYSHTILVIPMGGGVNLRFNDNFGARISCLYTLCMSHYVDNHDGGSNDSYIYTSVSLTYKFGKSEEEAESSARYKDVDWSKIENGDEDGDGVKDENDRCPGTPHGVAVDSKGCPLDADKDGVPDYKDKEPNTKKGLKVDANGVTLDYARIADEEKQKALQDSLAEARSNQFNQNPSLNTLKQIEDQRKADNNGSGKKLPKEYESVDKDHDGVISVAELNGAIDTFFNGDSDLTVEKINKLIDFFFEQ